MGGGREDDEKMEGKMKSGRNQGRIKGKSGRKIQRKTNERMKEDMKRRTEGEVILKKGKLLKGETIILLEALSTKFGFSKKQENIFH